MTGGRGFAWALGAAERELIEADDKGCAGPCREGMGQSADDLMSRGQAEVLCLSPFITHAHCIAFHASGTHPFLSGGLSAWGLIASSFTTFWNVSANGGQVQIAPPGYDTGTSINFVGVPFSAAAIASATFRPVIGIQLGWYREDLPAGYDLAVPELYSAMLAQRLAAMGGAVAALLRQRPS